METIFRIPDDSWVKPCPRCRRLHTPPCPRRRRTTITPIPRDAVEARIMALARRRAAGS